jgi:hypothetical protein
VITLPGFWEEAAYYKKNTRTLTLAQTVRLYPSKLQATPGQSDMLNSCCSYRDSDRNNLSLAVVRHFWSMPSIPKYPHYSRRLLETPPWRLTFGLYYELTTFAREWHPRPRLGYASGRHWRSYPGCHGLFLSRRPRYPYRQVRIIKQQQFRLHLFTATLRASRIIGQVLASLPTPQGYTLSLHKASSTLQVEQHTHVDYGCR